MSKTERRWVIQRKSDGLYLNWTFGVWTKHLNTLTEGSYDESRELIRKRCSAGMNPVEVYVRTTITIHNQETERDRRRCQRG